MKRMREMGSGNRVLGVDVCRVLGEGGVVVGCGFGALSGVVNAPTCVKCE